MSLLFLDDTDDDDNDDDDNDDDNDDLIQEKIPKTTMIYKNIDRTKKTFLHNSLCRNISNSPSNSKLSTCFSDNITLL